MKSVVFTEDNELLLVSSDSGTIHAFHIGPFIREKHPLVYVRKNEINSEVKVKVMDILKKNEAILAHLGKATVKQMLKEKVSSAELGNLSVPGVYVLT